MNHVVQHCCSTTGVGGHRFDPCSELSHLFHVSPNYHGINKPSKYFCFVTETSRFPPLDIAFVVSATTVAVDGNFKHIKSTIESIIKEHGVQKHLYALVVFGRTAKVVFPFRKDPNKATLVSKIKKTRPVPGPVDVVNALRETKKLFFSPEGGARPDSRKIIVVMIDHKTVNSGFDILDIAAELDVAKVRFVTVVIGNETNLNELVPLTPDKDKDNIVKVDKDTNPNATGKFIWDVMSIGKNTTLFPITVGVFTKH